MVEHSVALADYGKYVVAAFEAVGQKRLKRRKFQIGPFYHVVNCGKAREIKRASVDFIDKAFVEVDCVHELFQGGFTHAAFYFEPYGGAFPAVVKLVFYRLKQIFRFFVVEV